MADEKVWVELPKEIGDKIARDQNNQARVQLEKGKLTLNLAEPDDHGEKKRGYRWNLLTSLVATLVYASFLLISGTRIVQLSGTNSLSSAILTLGFVFAVIVFIAFFMHQRHSLDNQFAKNLYWRNLPVIFVTVSIISWVVLLGVFWFASLLFRGTWFDPYTATGLFWVASLLMNAALIRLAEILDAEGLFRMLSVSMIGGVALAMIFNNQQEWWKINLSFLGTEEAVNHWQFNLTLILSALLLIALIDYLFVHLGQAAPLNRRKNTLKILLLATAVNLGLVGVFPNNAEITTLHSNVAGFLVVLMLLMIVLIRWLLPDVGRNFLWFSYLIAVVLIFLEVLFQILAYLSLTAFEILAFATAFTWLVRLLNIIYQLGIPEIKAHVRVENPQE